MPTPGYVFRDSGTTPLTEADNPIETANTSNLKKRQTASSGTPKSNSTTSKPNSSKSSPVPGHMSESHALATADHEEKGAVQDGGRKSSVVDLGWKNGSKNVPRLVGKLPNEELWTLVRRFNKQMYHVKSIPQAPLAGLDLEIADEDEFSPDKLRSTFERLYMTMGVGLMGFANHIVRLRSWREPGRTAPFCAAYFIAWYFNLLFPAFLSTLIVLISFPESRPYLFPPAPLALVNSKTGGLQKPKAGVLGSLDSATGAPEKYQGEAVEQEASNLFNGITSVAISSAAGRHDPGEPDETDPSLPDPTQIAGATASASGDEVSHDKTKQPMEDAIWAKMRPAMHALGDLADVWERFANALSPTPPFSRKQRYKLTAVVAPILLISLVLKSAHVMRVTSFAVGFGFFGDPLTQRGLAYLNEKFPRWPKYVELRATILKGVPTNAQLTITLLRIGEANHAPLPPPPRSNEPPPDEPTEVDKDAIIGGGLDASHSEIEDAITVSDPPSGAEPDSHQEEKKKSGTGAKIMSFFKTGTAAGVDTKLTLDTVRAKVGSSHAKNHLGILPDKDEAKKKPIEGPIMFKGRFKGRKGAVLIDSGVSTSSASFPVSPCVYFTSESAAGEEEAIESLKKRPSWAVGISDIKEVKKVGGLGWKAKIVVGWATDKEVKEGMEIYTKAGDVFKVTALYDRDELFNRLIAIGQQAWESW